jgi:hypothetical protein
MYDQLDSLEKAAANEVLKAAREIYDKNKLKKNISFEKWLLDISQELYKISK